MMQTNLQLDLAFNYLENTGTNIFLTGKAGTGKTTFLKKLKDSSSERRLYRDHPHTYPWQTWQVATG